MSAFSASEYLYILDLSPFPIVILSKSPKYSPLSSLSSQPCGGLSQYIMTAVFCCPSGPKPYRPQILNHEPKFEAFLRWMPAAQEASTDGTTEGKRILSDDSSTYAIQVVRQVNYGPLESKRYFVSGDGGRGTNFCEITEGDLIEANFEKLNA
jgi:hypothetical protein